MAALLALSIGVALWSGFGGCGKSDGEREPRGPVTATTVKYIAAVARDGRRAPGIAVTSRRRGRCHAISDYMTGPVYKCIFGHFLADPCWRLATPGRPAASALCLPAPWSKRAIRIDTSRLERGGRVRRSRRWPWGLELATGERCRGRTGVPDLFKGRPVDYSCGDTPVYVLQGLHQRGRLWRADTVRYVDGRYRDERTIGIRTAWFVAPYGVKARD